MKVNLAGYNLDSEVIESLKRGEDSKNSVTPEVLSAAYARISRDPRPVNELRRAARQQVEKARKSNQNIIFKMGHHSVAEHAVFNFDIIDISRFCMEELEKFRLCSYTEKSQRYQKLEDNYIVPKEIKDSKFAKDFEKVIALQNDCYGKLASKVEAEDARYITSLATKGQLGLTLNARNLELLFRRFASSKFSEVRELGKQMFKQVEKIAPSIILFTEANPLDQKTYDEIRQYLSDKLGRNGNKLNPEDEVKLLNYTNYADEIILTSLLHTISDLPFEECRKIIKALPTNKWVEMTKAAFKNMEFYDATLREFEMVDLTFEIILSAAGFGQLKRHRMATLTCQNYDPGLGVTTPESIINAGLQEVFSSAIQETEKLHNKMIEDDSVKDCAHYILTNAHRRRVLFKCNARELYHISRLREGKHAQWDIQNIAAQMSNLARKVMPLTMLTISGKDIYHEVYSKVFGEKPKVIAEF